MVSSNSSAAGGAPATDGFLPHCSPRVFTSPELFAPGEYEAASQEAQGVLERANDDDPPSGHVAEASS